VKEQNHILIYMVYTVKSPFVSSGSTRYEYQIVKNHELKKLNATLIDV